MHLLLDWADRYRKLRVRTNADTPEDCVAALQFGAQGIGLCRTEHMFFNEQRIHQFRKMILAGKRSARLKHLRGLLPYQRKDFYKILSWNCEKIVSPDSGKIFKLRWGGAEAPPPG